MRRALLTLAALLAFAAPAQADTINVTSFEDSGNALCPSANQCTLRRAIELSKTNGNTVTDTIVLSAGTYLLNSNFGPLTTNTTNTGVTIAGAGADKTVISGGGSVRVLQIQGESSFTLRGLTIAGGNVTNGDGGNVFVQSADLVLDHVRLTGGQAVNGGGLGVQDGSQIVVSHTLIDGNTATASGGGVATMAGSELSLQTSTVTGNRAPEGGGISVNNSTTLLTQVLYSTIAYNTATAWSGGGVAVRLSAAAPTVVGSILAGNLGVGVPGNPIGPRNCSGTYVDGRGNVESGVECGFNRPESRQLANADLAPALTNDGGTLPVLPIGANSAARDLAGPCSGTDQRDVQRPQGAACDAGAYEYIAPPAPVVTPTPPPAATPAPTPTATPVVNTTVVVEPAQGSVLVKRKGSAKFEPLDATKGIPVGSTVDTRKGRVRLTSIPKAGAPPETALFYDGLFTVTQSRGITDLKLVEPLAACPKAGRASAAAKKAKKRRLWGDGKGAFRTSGRYSAATVRGTKWLVEDSCAGTLTRVTQGSVTVRRTGGGPTRIVRAGKRLLVRPSR